MSALSIEEIQAGQFRESLREPDPDKAPSYEGKDLRLQEVPCCANCRKMLTSSVLCCSRCLSSWYCNKECQKAHYKPGPNDLVGHKEICLAFHTQLDYFEKLTKRFQKMRIGSNSEPENFFETQVGNFGLWDATRVYLRVRQDLMEVYMGAAFAPQSKHLYEKALYHLHRDDDAFEFIRYWMKIDHTDEETLDQLRHSHAGTKDGDWIYPREDGCRFLDIFEECPDANDSKVPLAFLVALLIIKCRIVAAYDATCQSIDLAFETTGGQRIQAVQSAVKEMLINESLMNIESQRQQVERLVNTIHRNSRFMIPALFNPIPYFKREYESTQEGGPSDAGFVLKYCLRILLRVPGVEAMLEQRFGKKSVL